MNEWLQSVYSDTTKNFVSNPCPSKGEEITIRLRMIENEEIQMVLLRTREFGIEQRKRMELYQKEQGLIYYQVRVPIYDKFFHYQFYLVTKEKIYYYTQYRITDYIPDETRDFVILGDYQSPDWVKQSVFYQIFPDRFFNGNPTNDVTCGEYSYQGHLTVPVKEWNTPAFAYEKGYGLDFHNGDLDGILQKLDYLQDLGINAIYLNPIFTSPSVHKYDSLDFFEIDPHLGGEEALKKLIQEVHKRGMHIMMDISINHTSSAAKWFNKENEFYDSGVGAYHHPDAKERAYYFFDKENHYDTWCGVETMPKLNYESQELRNLIYRNEGSVLKKWLKEPYGIDGWRFDVADCLARNEILDVHQEILEEIRTNLKCVRKDCYLLAEDWADCSKDLQGNAWDATMNYFGCTRPVRAFFGDCDLFHARDEVLRTIPEKMTAKQLAERITQFYSLLPGVIQHQMFNLLDSHDVIRFYNKTMTLDDQYRGALMLMFALPGVPSIYYGDEILLEGSMEFTDACRYPFNWQWEKNPKSLETRTFYQKLIALRKESDALQEGGFQIVSKEGYLFAFARFTRKEVIFVICSTEDTEKQVKLPLSYFGIQSVTQKQDYFGTQLDYQIQNENMHLCVPAGKNIMLVLKTTRSIR